MVRTLPARPDLTHLKKQAKALVRSGSALRLVDAQRMVARDYGFASWAQLKSHVDALTATPVDALVSAVKANDLDATTHLLESHADLRKVLNDPLRGLSFGATILAPAVDRMSGEMVDLLLRFGADLNAKSHWWAGGFGPLDVCSPDFAQALIDRGAVLTTYSASRLGRMADVERLVAVAPESVHQRGGDGQTPLHVAATVEVARFLVEHGADINAIDVDHESTPAQYAIRSRQPVARYLIDLGCRTDILAVAAIGDVDRVRQFLDANADAVRVAVTDEFFPMRNAKAGGSIYIWALGRHKTAHVIAREFGHDAVFRLLMTYTSPSLELVLACELGDTAAIDRLLATRPDLATTLTEDELRALPAVAEANNIDAVRRMLAAGWPVDVCAAHGGAALHWAAGHGNADMVSEILRHGATVDLKDGAYQSPPLGWAFYGSRNGWGGKQANHAGAVEMLLAAGATPVNVDDIDASDEVLDVVCRRGRFGDSSVTEVD